MTVEKYEVIGKEADVAEWWKLADKAAQECHCQFTEGYDCGDLGDIVHAMKVLQRLTKLVSHASASNGNPVVIVSEGIFVSIPAKETVMQRESKYMIWQEHEKEYDGITFKCTTDYVLKDKEKEAVA